MPPSIRTWIPYCLLSSGLRTLLSRMSLEDKAGQLFHSQIGMGPGGTLADADPAFGLPSTENLVLGRRMTHFNLLGVVEDSRVVANGTTGSRNWPQARRSASRSRSPPIHGTTSPTTPVPRSMPGGLAVAGATWAGRAALCRAGAAIR